MRKYNRNIEKLVSSYLGTRDMKLRERRDFYSKSKDFNALLEDIFNYGSFKYSVSNKKEISSHFKNNWWYAKNQNGTTLRDELRVYLRIYKEELFTKRSFDEIYQCISNIKNELFKKGIKGMGKMTIYDVSLYIAHYLNFKPQEVYVHRGASVGAFHLGLIPSKSFEGHLSYSYVCKKVPELAKLDAEHIENFLCIFKNELSELKL